MALIEATRVIAADPAGVALMLAGPTATELLADRTALAGAGVEVQIMPPARAGIGFTATLCVLSQGRLVGNGTVSVQPAPGQGSLVAAVLQPAGDVNGAALGQWLRTGLDDLDAAARERSYAA